MKVSALRRWLRQERAREHDAAVTSGAYDVPLPQGRYWIQDWPPPGHYFTGVDWAVPGSDRSVVLRGVGSPSVEELAPHQDITAGDETVYPRDWDDFYAFGRSPRRG